MLYHLLLFSINQKTLPGVTTSQLQLLEYDFTRGKQMEKAVYNLSQGIRREPLCVIVDEAYGDLQQFCDKLLSRVPRLRLWAASCYHGNVPIGWQGEYLTRPLRSPPAVVREVEQDTSIRLSGAVKAYSSRGVPDHTDGPPVRRLYHGGQGPPGDCLFCGDEVARFLYSLRVGVCENDSTFKVRRGTPPTCLQWRDVLVLYGGRGMNIASMGMVRGMKEAGIPVRVMKDEDIEDVATASSNVVWVTNGDRVLGLEKKVIVCVEFDNLYDRLHIMSRCTSQLVMISPLKLQDFTHTRDTRKKTAEWQCKIPKGVDVGSSDVKDTNSEVSSGSSPELKVKDVRITEYRDVLPSSERHVSDHTDGPPVRRLYHRGQGHSGRWPGDCVTCGREVASFLHSLRVGVTESDAATSTTVTHHTGGATLSGLQWRDVMVLPWDNVSVNSGLVKGLREAGIPVRVMEDEDIEDVTTARSNVVWMAGGDRVLGLERKVVVCIGEPKLYNSARLNFISRCMLQLVIVSRDRKPFEDYFQSLPCHLL